MGLSLPSFYQCTCLNFRVSHLPSLSLLKWKANKQYVQLTRNASTWKCVKISFATWHANCKWNTWNVQSDKQLSHTFSMQMLKEKRLDLSKVDVATEVELFLNHFKVKSSSSDKQNKKTLHFGWYDEQQRPWSCLKTVAQNTRGLLVARKHFIWFFILLITAGSVAHLHCFSLASPGGFYICLPGGIASLLL